MRFTNDEIKQAVHSSHNYSLSVYYFQSDAVVELRISELSNHVGYYASALVNTNNYENECHMHISENGSIKRFECDCPYCKEDSACAHIGAMMMKIKQIDPQEFPYLYKSDEHNQQHATLLTKAEMDAYEIDRMKQREERIRRYREERKRLEEEEKRSIQRSRLHVTNQLIEAEKEKLIRSMSVDHSGTIRLQLCYDHSAVYTYTYGIYFQLKIARKRSYIVKNVFQLINDVREKKWFRYGKELDFVHDMDAFDEDSQRILHFLKDYTMEELEDRSISRTPYVSGHMLRKLYDLCDGLSEEYCDIGVIQRKLQLSLKLHEHKDYLQLELCNMPTFTVGFLDESGLYQVEGNSIVRYCMDEQGKCARLIRRFIIDRGEVLIAREDVSSFAKYIWQDIQPYCETIGNFSLLEVDDLDQLSLYGDMEDNGTLALRLEGRDEERRISGFDNSIKEKPYSLEIAETYIKGFANVIDMDAHVAYLPGDDDSTYSFLRAGLPFLQEYCDIYISDAILKLGSDHHVNLSAGVRIAEKLLEFSFESNEISQEELFDVLRSYRKKRRFHRLKNGQLISLDAQEIKEFDEIVELLHINDKQVQTGRVKVPLYRVFTLEALPPENNGFTIKRSAAAQHLQEAICQRDGGEFALPKHYEGVLRDYQVQGYQWLKLMNHYHFGAILADDMGLGKTLQVIALLESEKGHGPSLVVAPSSLLYNWQEEIAKFSHQLKALTIIGSAAKRAMAIQSIHAFDVAITSYDYLRRDIALYEDIQFHYAVLDEAQYIKNQKTKNAHSVKALQAVHRLALSGTPIENSLAELWSLFDFLMPGYLYHYRYFANEYEKPIVKDQDSKAQERLKRMVEPFILRRTKKEVLEELPEKIEQTIMIAFYEEEKKLYMANLMQVSKELQKQINSGVMDRIQVLAMLTKLRQLCCEPRLLYDNVYTASSKCNACVELCLSLRENHQRILLFSSFTTVLDLLEEEFSRYHFRILKLTGKHTKEERREMVRQFQEERADLFLISLKAGGTGLNLTAAEAVIHYDPWWNISAQNQATDRAYRMGQEKNVQVFSLIMKDSIEEKIRKLQWKKQNLADTFVENSDGSISSMSAQEIMALFE